MGVTFNLDAMVHYYEADCKMEPDTSKELAAKVLRRVEVSKAVRRLQNMMQLARLKIEHGWEDWTAEQIEQHLQDQLRKKNWDPVYDTDSTEGSALSVSNHPDESFPSSTSKKINGLLTPIKRVPAEKAKAGSLTGPRRRGRPALSSRAPRASWEDQHQLTQSSPVKPMIEFSSYSKHGRAALARMSPLKQSTTLSPAFTPLPALLNRRNVIDSDDENHDPILQSFSFSRDHLDQIPSSPPPRTPSPGRRSNRSQPSTVGQNSPKMPPVPAQEDADLLVFLANSPSTTIRDRKRKRDMTPDNDLPSSYLDTPNGKDVLNGSKSPWAHGLDLNIYDFVATPSPGQLHLGGNERTPRFHQTPLMGPPAKKTHLSTASPNMSTESGNPTTGLGMSFGPKLVS